MCEKDLASLSGVGSPTGFLLEDEPFQFPPFQNQHPSASRAARAEASTPQMYRAGAGQSLPRGPCLCCSWCLSVGRNLLESCCILIAVTGNLQTILRGQ